MDNRIIVRRRTAGIHFLQHRITTGVSSCGVTELVTAEAAEASWLGYSRKHWLLAPAGTFSTVIEQCCCELFLTCKGFCYSDLGKARSQEAALFVLTWWEGHWCTWTRSMGVQNRGMKEFSCVPCEALLEQRCCKWTPLQKVFVFIVSVLLLVRSTWLLSLNSNCSFVAGAGEWNFTAGWSSGECLTALLMLRWCILTSKCFFLREQGFLSRSEVMKDLKLWRSTWKVFYFKSRKQLV